ncbi:hypothetical protein C8R45DRAFT_1209383 [Mycena sanguinolenta]|nr:hypothetical protein C8R45DRAFT_1209383 [Mycena sanguinolenta]
MLSKSYPCVSSGDKIALFLFPFILIAFRTEFRWPWHSVNPRSLCDSVLSVPTAPATATDWNGLKAFVSESFVEQRLPGDTPGFENHATYPSVSTHKCPSRRRRHGKQPPETLQTESLQEEAGPLCRATNNVVETGPQIAAINSGTREPTYAAILRTMIEDVMKRKLQEEGDEQRLRELLKGRVVGGADKFGCVKARKMPVCVGLERRWSLVGFNFFAAM